MKFRKIILVLIALLFIVGGISAWLLLSSATRFEKQSKFIYIRDDNNIKEQVMSQLADDDIIRTPQLFEMLANQMNVWQRIKPGRFEIRKGQSILKIARMFRNNQQSDVRFTINRIRTKEELSRLIGKNFKVDSLAAITFLSSNDSLASLGVDTSTVFTLIIPDTYYLSWGTPVKNILQRLQKEKENFWSKDNRLQKATELNLSTTDAYILASIVEEETNNKNEKGKIASVYINRLNIGMNLGACPTVKYALRDFGLRRILYVHLNVESPYNTYRNKGLPPGPICTPSQNTIDAVLNAPKTDYLFFVASADFSDTHHFSNNFAEHDHYAKLYQKALDEKTAQKQNSTDN